MTNTHIAQTILELISNAEPDESGSIPEEVQHQVDALVEVSQDPEKVKQLFGQQVQMGWQPYQGDQGGQGWFNDETGEIRYQQERPRDRSQGQDQTSQAPASQAPAEEQLTPEDHWGNAWDLAESKESRQISDKAFQAASIEALNPDDFEKGWQQFKKVEQTRLAAVFTSLIKAGANGKEIESLKSVTKRYGDFIDRRTAKLIAMSHQYSKADDAVNEISDQEPPESEDEPTAEEEKAYAEWEKSVEKAEAHRDRMEERLTDAVQVFDNNTEEWNDKIIEKLDPIIDAIQERYYSNVQTQMSFPSGRSNKESADPVLDEITQKAQQAGIVVSDEVRKRVTSLLKKK